MKKTSSWKMGSQGPDVAAWQLALQRAGYYSGMLDGAFGIQTLDSVLRFQQDRHLAEDGIVGILTIKALTPYLTGYSMYETKEGDTLGGIAKAFRATPATLLTANGQKTTADAPLPGGQKVTVPLPFPVVPTHIPFTYRLLEYTLQGLAARYPFLHTRVIGRSANGRRLYAVQMGGGEGEVMYNGAHHANEWITTPLLLKFLEAYAESYATGGMIAGLAAASLFDRTTLHIVPMVNPDGVDLVTGALQPGDPQYDRALAMNDPPVDFPDGWKANLRGVDINLNYPAGWETAKEIKYAMGYTHPGPRDFVGERPLSEQESSALAVFTHTHRFRLTLSYHTQGQEIYWRYLDYQPPRAREIAEAFAAASGYTVADVPFVSGHAGYKDWYIQVYNLPGFTVEAGKGKSPLPLTQFDQIYRDNEGILALGLQLWE